MVNQKSDNEGISGNDLAYNVSLSLPSREGLQGGVQYQRVEENFRPALGFANRTGVRLVGANIGYNHVLSNPNFIREVEGLVNFSRWNTSTQGACSPSASRLKFRGSGRSTATLRGSRSVSTGRTAAR